MRSAFPEIQMIFLFQIGKSLYTETYVFFQPFGAYFFLGTMMSGLQIVWYDILPLIVFIAAGWFLDGKFRLDENTYRKLTSYVVLPCFVFYNLDQYKGESSWTWILPAAAGLLLILYGVSLAVSYFLPAGSAGRKVFRAAAVFPSSGHIGAALVFLVYTQPPFGKGSDTPFLPEAMGAMIVLMLLMELLVHTVGASLAKDRIPSWKEALLVPVKMPVLYAAVLAEAARFFGISVEHTFLWPVLEHFNGAFIILITVTIGVWLRRHHAFRVTGAAAGAAFCKLFLSPAIAAGFLLAIRPEDPVAAQVFLIYAALPSSLALIMYARQEEACALQAEQTVSLAAVLGIFTVPAVIWLSRLLFPVTGG